VTGVQTCALPILDMTSPEVTACYVHIKAGKLTSAAFIVNGGFSLDIEFTAASESGVSGNIHRFVQAPTDSQLPIAGPGIPIHTRLEQLLVFQSLFTAKNST